ncbi:MAG: hypothetical protein ACLGHT_03720 [Acidimicrobiia bacterium]
MDDEVLERRERIRTLVNVGKRGGYGLFMLAIVGFFIALVTGPTPLLVSVVVGSIAVGSLLLAPAIVFGYGIAAAEREERGEARH